MNRDFYCRIAPYALFNALKALELTNDRHRYIEYGITQEGDDLVIWGKEHLHGTGNFECANTAHEPPEVE